MRHGNFILLTKNYKQIVLRKKVNDKVKKGRDKS